MNAVDLVVVGGGVAGSAAAIAFCEAGHSVLVLEKSEAFEDRVRGEWLAPWGVAEAKTLGIYDTLIEAGGHHLLRQVGYDELLPPEVAEAGALDLGVFHPAAPGPLAIEHVVMQNRLLERARRCGAVVERGVGAVRIETGTRPVVSYTHGGESRTVGGRFVLGADGRTSGVRRQLGIELNEDPIDHLIAGLLVEGLERWPAEQQSIGKVGDIQYLVFPQGGGRARLYADYDASGRGRFSGEEGVRHFLASFRAECIPGSDEIAEATPLGPCRSYPSQDTWTERPIAPGAALVGDAAGYNDPIIGQGLSIAFRDVRMVRDLLLDGGAWSADGLEAYATERRERLRRLRITAQAATRLGARFDAASVAARARAMQRIGEDPSRFPLVAAFAGPENAPPAHFDPDALDALFAA